MTGFVLNDSSVWARPVGVAVAHDGALLVSKDGNGTMWRVSYRGGPIERGHAGLDLFSALGDGEGGNRGCKPRRRESEHINLASQNLHRDE